MDFGYRYSLKTCVKNLIKLPKVTCARSYVTNKKQRTHTPKSNRYRYERREFYY